MATWDEIKQFSRTKFKLIKDEPEWFAIDFALPENRAQRIIVSHLKTQTREWLEFKSAICKEGEISPVVALRKNSEFTFGGIALSGDLFFYKYSVQLATMDPDEFLVPLLGVAVIADELERTYAATDKM